MTAFIELFSERIDYASFNKEECAMLDSARPLLQKSTNHSLYEAVEILENVFKKNENGELAMFMVTIYNSLGNENKANEWMQKWHDIHKKRVAELNAKFEALGYGSPFSVYLEKLEEDEGDEDDEDYDEDDEGDERR